MKTLLGTIDFSKILTPQLLLETVKVAAIIILGFILVRVIASLVRRALAKNLSERTRMILQKTIVYAGVAIIIIAVLGELGVKLSALLGAAGVVGIAVGIASQTSLGNIISGLFLVSEKTFVLGDVVTVGDKTGVIYAIDPLSIKLRTFDNLLIRIPNQTIITTELTNVTRFPIRRMDLAVGVGYGADLAKVKETLLSIARANPLVLEEPEPLFVYNSFAESSINLTFGVWYYKDNYLELRNSLFQTIKARFDEEGIEIPFPQRTLSVLAASDPFPVRVVGERGIDGRRASAVGSKPDAVTPGRGEAAEGPAAPGAGRRRPSRRSRPGSAAEA